MLAIGYSALLMSLGCAVLFSASDYFRKAVPDGCRPETILFYFMGGQIPVLAAWVLIGGDTEPSLSLGYIGPGLMAAALGFASNLLFIIAIRRSPLSLMIPLLGLVPVLTAVWSGIALGEWLSPRQNAGILLVAAGLLVLFQPGPRLSLNGAWNAFRAQSGAIPMSAVVVLWSLTPALDKICVARSSVGLHGIIQLTLIWAALGIWMLPRGREAFAVPRSARAPLAGAALSGGVAYGLQLGAYQLTLVALVEVLKRTVGLVGALMFGGAVFREPVTAARIAGITIMAIGLPLIMLA